MGRTADSLIRKQKISPGYPLRLGDRSTHLSHRRRRRQISQMSIKSLSTPKKNRNVLLLLNDPLLLLGTTGFLEQNSDFNPVHPPKNPEEISLHLSHKQIDAILFELSLFGSFDFKYLKKLRIHHPEIPILALSPHEEVFIARRAIAEGASGYLMKDAPPEKLPEAIRQILNGEIFLTRRMLARIEREELALRQNILNLLTGSKINYLELDDLEILKPTSVCSL